MKRKESILFLIGVLSICGCGQKAQKGELVTDESRIEKEMVVKEQVQADEAQENAEKPERLNTTKYENLSKVAEQVGFSFKAPQEFSNGRTFSNFSVSEETENVENINSVIHLNYKWGKNPSKMELKIYQTSEEMEKLPTYVSSKDMKGITVCFTEYIVRNVPENYEMTEEDWELYNAGKVGFSAYDGVTWDDEYIRGAYWKEEDICYILSSGEVDMPIENVEGLVEEILKADYQ